MGKIVQVIGPVIDVEFESGSPARALQRAEIEAVARVRQDPVVAEVQQHIGRNQVRAVAMSTTDGVVRGMDVTDTGAAIAVPVGAPALGRILNVLGEPVDDGRRFPASVERWPIHRKRPDFVDLEPKTEIFETGIKVIDLIAPFVKGGKIGLFGGAGVGKTVVIRSSSTTSPRARRQVGVLRRGRAHARGQRPLPRVQGSRRHRQGRPDLRPDERAAGCPFARGLSGLTVAEYFRDMENADVLVFIDNIFRFTQAGSEVSALLGRMPSAVGYQPTLATEMGDLQERITSTRNGSITSVQAIYVPADDLTDPAPATAFAHLDATVVLSARSPSSASTPPWIRSTRRQPHPRPAVHRRAPLQRRHRRAAHPAALQGAPGHHRHPRHGRALRGRQEDRRPRAPHPALHVAALLRGRAVHRPPGQVREARGDHLLVRAPLAGEFDHLPEQAFFMAGGIDDVVENAKKLAG
jgi:F-type H+-transporting ATPase subunit beta